MSKLVTLNKEKSDEILDRLFNDEIIVLEDIQGSKIWVNWDGKKFRIKSKSIKNDDINLIDLAIQNYYNFAMDYFNSMDNRVKGLLNKKWWFCFEYFPDQQPANIEYSRTPNNNLVLTGIWKNKKFQVNLDEIEEYSRLLDVDMIPVIFSGKLTDEMKEAITYFLNTSKEDLEFVFEEKSFAFFFYKLLNPFSKNSFLMEDDFQNNVEKLIIRSKTGDISFELLNPLYEKMSSVNDTEFVEIYTLILVNFLNFCQSITLKEIRLKSKRKDEMYIELICNMFNKYMLNVKSDLVNFQFSIPEFFDKEKFKINKELIPNAITRQHLESNEKIEYIFKIILGSFKKKKKRAIGIFEEKTVVVFNKYIDDISTYIDTCLKIEQQRTATKKGLVDFGEYFEINYDTDGEGKVYPDIYNEFEKGKLNKKSKKNKGEKSK
jgi:hypothetical protein|tara:strand:- start:371 stop:1669 length:1299 start_codon:yes stop_codon:yes gene_type:complete